MRGGGNMGPNLLKVIFQTCQLDQNVALPKIFRIWFPFTDEKSQLLMTYNFTSHPLPFAYCAPATVAAVAVAVFLFLKHIAILPTSGLGT